MTKQNYTGPGFTCEQAIEMIETRKGRFKEKLKDEYLLTNSEFEKWLVLTKELIQKEKEPVNIITLAKDKLGSKLIDSKIYQKNDPRIALCKQIKKDREFAGKTLRKYLSNIFSAKDNEEFGNRLFFGQGCCFSITAKNGRKKGTTIDSNLTINIGFDFEDLKNAETKNLKKALEILEKEKSKAFIKYKLK